MNLENIVFINDGEEIDRKTADEWEIIDYCDVYNKKITISFVGLVVHADRIIFSFPKHYSAVNLAEYEKINCMKEILSVIATNRINKGSFDTDPKELKDEFPLKAYIQIKNYYRKFGIYKSLEKYTQVGYNGRINWSKTINKSNKILQDNNILFYPFILNKVRDKDVFIGECMDYILNDATKYSGLIDRIIRYQSKNRNKAFNNLKYVCNQLKQLKSVYFKDSEKKLIDSLIEYFEWKSKFKDNMKMITLKFEDYWEDMISVYLNGCFSHVESDRIIWRENQNNSFKKPKQEYVESENIRNRYGNGYRIGYDHFMVRDNKIYIFDSKYYDEIDGLNYKQLFYHYHLNQQYPNHEIINGLILPTEKNYYAEKHIDRMDLDKVKIDVHYINLREVLRYYQNNT